MQIEDLTKAVVETPVIAKVTFDLGSIDTIKDANTGAEVELYHPIEGTDLGITVRVVGHDGDLFKQIQAEQNRKRIQKMQKTQFKGVVDADQEAIELLAGCTQGWAGMVLGGKEVPFSYENAVALYTKYPWMKEQIDVAVGDRSVFTKASSKA